MSAFHEKLFSADEISGRSHDQMTSPQILLFRFTPQRIQLDSQIRLERIWIIAQFMWVTAGQIIFYCY